MIASLSSLFLSFLSIYVCLFFGQYGQCSCYEECHVLVPLFQGLSISRSNRRATGPVNPEDLAPAMSLRLATAQPYSPASVRSNAGTLPTMTSRFSEKAQSLPPASNGMVRRKNVVKYFYIFLEVIW